MQFVGTLWKLSFLLQQMKITTCILLICIHWTLCNGTYDQISAVLNVDYSPIGKEFVSASFDKSICIFPVDKSRSREVYHTK
ncbi:unnamed protein product [Gulo gulo]|uniref:Uncharacterized protein n=1 Tax=Gulo gulo TaxID=48420 RepID=A0A9X9PWE6_GULGU|nr:unnamed protein product [Gulo gulo]